MDVFKYDSLALAVSQLRDGFAEANAHLDNKLMRDGVIQRFEYTMDLAWKLMQRYLKVIAQVDESVLRSKKDIFREAARIKLIDDAEAWIAHYEARNETSHDYHASKANLVYARIQFFLPDVELLLKAFDNVNA